MGEGGGGVVDLYQGVGGGGARGGYYLIVFVFLFVFLSFVLSCPVSFLIEYSMIAVVSVSLFIIGFLCLWSLSLRVPGPQKLLCL